jgi:hypothetical protein
MGVKHCFQRQQPFTTTFSIVTKFPNNKIRFGSKMLPSSGDTTNPIMESRLIGYGNRVLRKQTNCSRDKQQGTGRNH